MARQSSLTAYPSDKIVEKVYRIAEREKRSVSWVVTQFIEKCVREYEAEKEKRKR